MDTKKTQTIQRRYDGRATLYDLTEAPIEFLLFGGLRRSLWHKVTAERLLEIGVGTGKNISLYPECARVVAIDVSPRMLLKASGRADKMHRDVDFVLADAQMLPF